MSNRGKGPGDSDSGAPKSSKPAAPAQKAGNLATSARAQIVQPRSGNAQAPAPNKREQAREEELKKHLLKSPDSKPKKDSEKQEQKHEEPERPAMPTFKPGQVNQGFIRDAPVQVDKARAMGLSQGPSTREVVAGKLAEKMGASFAELLPGARTRNSPKLDEPDMRPPPFLSPFEAMKDIYLRTRGRASPRTLELLEGPTLEDLVNILGEIHGDSDKLRKPECRIKGSIFAHVRDGESPVLIGFQDPRLAEPWRLFLNGWDVWVPEKKSGVELFWEGEAEDDDGNEIEILQALRLVDGELTLETKFGPDSDAVSYDGEGFFRLRSTGAT